MSNAPAWSSTPALITVWEESAALSAADSSQTSITDRRRPVETPIRADQDAVLAGFRVAGHHPANVCGQRTSSTLLGWVGWYGWGSGEGLVAGVAGAGPDREEVLEFAENAVEGQAGIGAFGS